MAITMDLSTLSCEVLLVFSMTAYVSHGETTEEWRNIAKVELDKSLNVKQNNNVAKNVILFIGDGMGASSVTGARVLKAQLAGQQGKQPLLSFEKFPVVGLSKTYSNDRLTALSAATATALMCGVKINDGTIGVSPTVQWKDCAASKRESNQLSSIVKWSIDKGKSGGFVTTSRVSHATPAAAYAHTANRYWEGVTEVADGCKDIAAQLVDNLDLKVILGGGRRYFLLDNQTDPQTDTIHRKQRTDGRDLIKEWKDKQTSKNMKAEYVYKKAQFDAVRPAETDYLLGLFAVSHMSYDADRNRGPDGQPSLAEMTRKAIQILKKNKNGFFLLVEGARIDHAHHSNHAKRALVDVLAVDEAVVAATAETDEEDTLIVVTADHSHVFNIAGYTTRQTDIFGFADIVDVETEAPYDDMPYTTLIYGNGPGPGRTNLTGQNTTDIEFQQPNAVQMAWETHSGEDVAIYAHGPMAHLFHGVHEQHYIAHVMAYASCVGTGKTRCMTTPVDPCVGSSSKVHLSIVLLLTTILFSRMIDCFL